VRILAVEDHADTLEVMCAMLTRLGHQVITATTLAEARRLCAAPGPELLICDIGLPDGDGWELGPLASQCGISAIALTGYGMPSDLTLSHNAGFRAHLLKPVKMSDLQRAMAECMRSA
jgi:CheY-like chemotaxis protein